MVAFKCHDPPKSKTSEDCARLNQDCARDLLWLLGPARALSGPGKGWKHGFSQKQSDSEWVTNSHSTVQGCFRV